MERLKIDLGERSYDILLGSGLLGKLGGFLSKILKPSRIVLITHPSLFQLYGDKVLSGFKDQKADTISSLSYWVVTGGKEPGKIISENSQKLADYINIAEQSLIRLINTFDDENIPYYSTPNIKNIPRFNDYEHLARMSEWADTSDEKNNVGNG